MGLFWSSTKSVVSKREFSEKVLAHLSVKGWSDEDRARVKMVFSGHLNEVGDDAGIDAHEITEGILVLKKTGAFSSDQLRDLEKYMRTLAR